MKSVTNFKIKYFIVFLFCLTLKFSFAGKNNLKNTIFLNKNNFDSMGKMNLHDKYILGNKFHIATFNSNNIHFVEDTINSMLSKIPTLEKIRMDDSSYFEFWFKVFIDSSMVNKTIGIELFGLSDADIVFWDNNLIARYGRIDVIEKKAFKDNVNLDPFPIFTGKIGYHTLLVKSYRKKDFFNNSQSITFLNINLIKDFISYSIKSKKKEYSLSYIFLDEGFRFFLLCVFVISLLFYLIVLPNKTFFWFSLFCFSTLIIAFLEVICYQLSIYNGVSKSILGLTFFCFSAFSLVAFIFQNFIGKVPNRIFYYLSILPLSIISFYVSLYLKLNPTFYLKNIMGPVLVLTLVVVIIEILIKIIYSIIHKKKRILFIAFGVLQIILIFPILSFIGTKGETHPLFILSIYLLPISVLITIIYIVKDSFTDNINKQAEVVLLTQANEKILQEQNIILEQKVTERTAEVIEEKQKVEEKQKEILDSIEYALRIQNAILPPQKIVKQYLENSFILYKPKDIVAGDFYWMENIGEVVLFAACDCTGHGVPGAMVSVVCHNALNRAVREFGLLQPASILDKTSEIVLENFSKSEEEIQDGMDISICSYNTKTKSLEWAGANNSLLLINNGQLTETKADKQCIGYNDNVKPFTNHQFNLQSDTNIYLFTDGFSDQFGGQPERKLTKKRFKELLFSMQNLPIQQQAKELDDFIMSYKKETEQTDDILVIGVKV
jgi:serine phosphatase RsbU (regulator of sigma subunit)